MGVQAGEGGEESRPLADWGGEGPLTNRDNCLPAKMHLTQGDPLPQGTEGGGDNGKHDSFFFLNIF